MIQYWKCINKNRFKLNRSYKYSGKHIYLNDGRSKYNSVREQGINSLVKNLIIILGFILISSFLYGIGPLYVYFVHDIRATPMATRLPYFEYESDVGFALNIFQQSVASFFGMVGTCCIEFAVCLVNNSIVCIPKLIGVDLIELSNEMEMRGLKSNTKLLTRDIFMKILEFDR